MDAKTQINLLTDGLGLSEEQLAQLAKNLTQLNVQTLLESDEATSRLKEGTRLTRGGLNLLAKAVAGQTLKYTRAAIGDSMRDGQFVEVSVEEGLELTELINHRIDLPLVDVRFTGAGTAAIKFALQNANLTETIFNRELGLFAEDPDTGEEVLYCYRNVGLLGEPIPAGGGAVLWDLIMTIVTVVDSAQNVTAIIDANLAYVSQAEFNAHVNSPNPHPNAPSLSDEISTTTKLWATDNDKNLHPIDVDEVSKLVLKGDASDIPSTVSQVKQNTVNIANLYMSLKAKQELGLDSNLLLVENFVDNDCWDSYECEVVSSFASSDQLNLASDAGILSGHYYTITDGVNSEYVQVRSVARNGSQVAAFLKAQLVYTYNLEATRLLRSTALVTEGMAQGAGDLRGVQFKFDEIFAGVGGDVTTLLTLETSQNNADAFDLEGDFAFNTSGEFTLMA